MAAPDTSSALGYGLSNTLCAASLPFPIGNGQREMRDVVTIQPPFVNLGRSLKTGAYLPDVTSGRALLGEAIVRRISCVRGALPDVNIPTTTGNYGIDILDAVYADMDPQAVGELNAATDAQVQLDERIINSHTTGTLLDGTLLMVINAQDGAGPFRLTITIDTLNSNLTVISAP